MQADAIHTAPTMAAAQQEIADLPLDRLEADIVELAVRLGSRMQRWLSLVAEFDARGGPRKSGFRSTAEWLGWRCSIGGRAARDHVRVARRLRELPLVNAAFATGDLSYSKVRALARAATGEDETALLQLARESTAARLESVVRSLRSATSADQAVANRGHDRRCLNWWWDEDGLLRFAGRLASDEGAALIAALETGAEALHPERPLEDPGRRAPLGARRADALTEIVLSGAPRVHVMLHADLPALGCTAVRAEDRAGAICAIEDGPAVPSETARRLTCDAEIVGDHGRRRRVVSPALRLSLERRDLGCRFPGCVRRHGLHAHHVTHWAHGGSTDGDNLILLCRFHHRLVHEEGFEAKRDGGVLAFRRPDGRTIPRVPSTWNDARAGPAAVVA